MVAVPAGSSGAQVQPPGAAGGAVPRGHLAAAGLLPAGTPSRSWSPPCVNLGPHASPPGVAAAAEQWPHPTGLSPFANGFPPAGPWLPAQPASACTHGTLSQSTPFAVWQHPLHLPQQPQEAREDEYGSSSCGGSVLGSNTSAISLSWSRAPQSAVYAHASSAVLTSSITNAHAGSSINLSMCAQTPVACRTPPGYARSSTSASNYSPFTPPAARLHRPLPPLPPLPAVRRSGCGTSTSLPGYAPLPVAPPPGASPLGWAAGATQQQHPYIMCSPQQRMHPDHKWHQLYPQPQWATGMAGGPGASSCSAGGGPPSACRAAATAPGAQDTSAVGPRRISSARMTPHVEASSAVGPSCPASSACISPLWVAPGGAGEPVVSGPAAGCPAVACGQSRTGEAQGGGSLGRCGNAEPMLYAPAGAAGTGGVASGPGLQRLVVRAEAEAGQVGVGGSSGRFVHCVVCVPLAPLHEAAEGGP